jgi:hypothetical protein
VIPARSISGWLSLVSSVVVAVAATTWLDVSGDVAKVVVGLTLAGPPLVVALLGPSYRVIHLFAAASVAYASWFCLVAHDRAETAQGEVLDEIPRWPVAAAWTLAGALVVASLLEGVRRWRRRRSRRHAK